MRLIQDKHNKTTQAIRALLQSGLDLTVLTYHKSILLVSVTKGTPWNVRLTINTTQ